MFLCVLARSPLNHLRLTTKLVMPQILGTPFHKKERSLSIVASGAVAGVSDVTHADTASIMGFKSCRSMKQKAFSQQRKNVTLLPSCQLGGVNARGAVQIHVRSPQPVFRSEVRCGEKGGRGKDSLSDSSEERPHLVHRERS